MLDEIDVEFVDLLPEFRRVTYDGANNLYWWSDRHWNPDGHALAAENVVSHLL